MFDRLLALVDFFRLNIIQPPVTIMQERLDAEELFTECFDKVVEKVTKCNKHLVIFIDNLDRLTDDKMVEALESLKTYICNENCIFVVACDDNVVRAVINSSEKIFKSDEHSRLDGRVGEHYLDKFFQQTFRLPEYMGINLQDFAVNNFKTTQLYEQLKSKKVDTRNLISIILPSDINSPRKVKRLLNEFISLYEIAKRRENEVGGQLRPGILTGNVEFLGKFSTIRAEYPEFYQILINNTSLLSKITENVSLAVNEINKDLKEEFKEVIQESLVAYIRKTQSIMVDDIEPYIWLSQDVLSLGLKREHYNQLRTSLSNGDVERLKLLLSESDNEYKALIIQIASRLVESRLIGIEQQNGVKVLSQLLPDYEETIRQELANVVVKIIPQLKIYEFSANELFNVIRWAGDGGVSSQKRKIINNVLERLYDFQYRQSTIDSILKNADILKNYDSTVIVQRWLEKFLIFLSGQETIDKEKGLNEDEIEFVLQKKQGHLLLEWMIVQGLNYSENHFIIDDYFSSGLLDYIFNRLLGVFPDVEPIGIDEELGLSFIQLFNIITSRIQDGVKVTPYWNGLFSIINQSLGIKQIDFCLKSIRELILFFPEEFVDKTVESLFKLIQKNNNLQSDQAMIDGLIAESLNLIIELRRIKNKNFEPEFTNSISSIFAVLCDNQSFQGPVLSFTASFVKEFGDPDSKIFISGVGDAFKKWCNEQTQGYVFLNSLINLNSYCSENHRELVIESVNSLITSNEQVKIEPALIYIGALINLQDYRELFEKFANNWIKSIPNDNSTLYQKKIQLYDILLKNNIILIADYIQENIQLFPFGGNQDCLLGFMGILEKSSSDILASDGGKIFEVVVDNLHSFVNKTSPLHLIVRWLNAVDENYRSLFNSHIYNSFKEAPFEYLQILSFTWDYIKESEIQDQIIQFYTIDKINSSYEELRDSVTIGGLNDLSKSDSFINYCSTIWTTIITQNKDAESFMKIAVRMLALESLTQLRTNAINSIRENRAANSQQSEYDLRLLAVLTRDDMRELMPTVDLFVNLFGGSSSESELALKYVVSCISPLKIHDNHKRKLAEAMGQAALRAETEETNNEFLKKADDIGLKWFYYKKYFPSR